MALLTWFRDLVARASGNPPQEEPPQFGGAGATDTWEPPKAPPKLPRGLRNRNPGNIRGSQFRWLGEVGRDKDGFVVFATDELGLRALARLLINYNLLHHLCTVDGIIGRWAPAVENDTRAYVNAVAREMGVQPRDQLDMMNRRTVADLTRAIVRHENGLQPYTPGVIATAVDLAFAGI